MESMIYIIGICSQSPSLKWGFNIYGEEFQTCWREFCRGTEVLAMLVKGGSKKFPLLRRGEGVGEHICHIL